MKTRIVWAAVLVMLAVGSVRADNEWGVFGTWWSPSDGDDSGGGGIKIGIEMVDRVQLDLRWSVYDSVLDTPAGAVDVEPLEAGLSFASPLNEDLEASLGAGIGYYMMSGAGADDETGFFLSAGLEWTVSRSGASYGETSVKLFTEALYRFVDASTSFGDADLDGPAVMAGLLIGW